METQTMYPVIRWTLMTIIAWGLTMAREALPKETIGQTAIPSTIIGNAASIGKTKTMMDMMTAMTDSGLKGSFDTLFSYSDFQLKRI